MSVAERERGVSGKIQKKAYEDKERGSEGVVKCGVTASWGVRRRGGQERTRGETERWRDREECSVWTFMCVCWRKGGVDGCKGDVLTQPRVSRGYSRAKHIITQGGRELDWTASSVSTSTTIHAWGKNSTIWHVIPYRWHREWNQNWPFSLGNVMK